MPDEKKDLNQKSREKDKKNIARISEILLWISVLFYIILLILYWVNSAGFVSPNSFFYGFDYIPAVVFFLLVVPLFFLELLAKKKYISFSLVALFVLSWLFYGEHSLFGINAKAAHPAGKTGINILTLNVSHFDYGIDIVGKKIEELNADIVCFQEISQQEKEINKKILDAFPSYHIKVGQMCDLATLSRHPFIDFKEVQLSTRQPAYENNTLDNQINNPHRHFLHGIISIDDNQVHIINIRLIAGRGVNFDISPYEVIRWGRYLTRQQNREAREIADYIAKLKGAVIFAGDLNAPPNSNVVKIFSNLGYDANLITNRIPASTFPTGYPYQRLDYVFCNSGLNPVSSEVLPWKISDHLPVLACVTLRSDKGK